MKGEKKYAHTHTHAHTHTYTHTPQAHTHYAARYALRSKGTSRTTKTFGSFSTREPLHSLVSSSPLQDRERKNWHSGELPASQLTCMWPHTHTHTYTQTHTHTLSPTAPFGPCLPGWPASPCRCGKVGGWGAHDEGTSMCAHTHTHTHVGTIESLRSSVSLTSLLSRTS